MPVWASRKLRLLKFFILHSIHRLLDFLRETAWSPHRLFHRRKLQGLCINLVKGSMKSLIESVRWAIRELHQRSADGGEHPSSCSQCTRLGRELCMCHGQRAVHCESMRRGPCQMETGFVAQGRIMRDGKGLCNIGEL